MSTTISDPFTNPQQGNNPMSGGNWTYNFANRSVISTGDITTTGILGSNISTSFNNALLIFNTRSQTGSDVLGNFLTYDYTTGGSADFSLASTIALVAGNNNPLPGFGLALPDPQFIIMTLSDGVSSVSVSPTVTGSSPNIQLSWSLSAFNTLNLTSITSMIFSLTSGYIPAGTNNSTDTAMTFQTLSINPNDRISNGMTVVSDPFTFPQIAGAGQPSGAGTAWLPLHRHAVLLIMVI